MKNVVTLFCLLVTLVANAQFSGAGYYRVHNVYTDAYICINGTRFVKSTYPDAFWPCIKMKTDSAQVTDPGSIIYIEHIGEDCDLYSQGASTYALTRLMMTVTNASVNEKGIETYLAKTYYEYMVDSQLVAIDCMFRDMGFGLQAGSKEKQHSRWWIEPVNEQTIDTSFFGVMPSSPDMKDTDGYYWTSLCCDFPVAIPADGGVMAAYTITHVEQAEDECYYAEPVLLCGQGDTIPAATPVIIKCKHPYASGNKLIPVGQKANNTVFPIVKGLLMGNYFSDFVNHNSLSDINSTAVYVPDQATPASSSNLALGIDDRGRLGFFPQEEGTYMAANTAWLGTMSLRETMKAVYLDLHEESQKPQVILGDADGNGRVDVNDVVNLIDFLLGGKSVSVSTGADANGDGVVDISDIAQLIDLILNK